MTRRKNGETWPLRPALPPSYYMTLGRSLPLSDLGFQIWKLELPHVFPMNQWFKDRQAGAREVTALCWKGTEPFLTHRPQDGASGKRTTEPRQAPLLLALSSEPPTPPISLLAEYVGGRLPPHSTPMPAASGWPSSLTAVWKDLASMPGTRLWPLDTVSVLPPNAGLPVNWPTPAAPSPKKG